MAESATVRPANELTSTSSHADASEATKGTDMPSAHQQVASRSGYRTSIATACLSGTLEDKLAAAAAARFHGVELAASDLIASSWSPGRIRQECARRGLAIDAYQLLTDMEAVPPQVFEANLRRAERTLD